MTPDPFDAAAAAPTPFDQLLAEAAALVHPGLLLRTALCTLLTLGGRIPLERGLRTLTPLQSALLRRAALAPLCALPAAGRKLAAGDAVTWLLGIHRHGRVWLAPAWPARDEAHALAAVAVPRLWHESALARAAEVAVAQAPQHAQVERFFGALDGAARRRVAARAQHAIARARHVRLMVSEHDFVHGVAGCRVDDLEALDTPAKRTLAWALHWLDEAGCPAGAFSGRLLDPVALDEHLALELGARGLAAPPPAGVEAKAAALARLAAPARWRDVHGLDLHVRDHVAGAEPERAAPSVPPRPGIAADLPAWAARLAASAAAETDSDAAALGDAPPDGLPTVWRWPGAHGGGGGALHRLVVPAGRGGLHLVRHVCVPYDAADVACAVRHGAALAALPRELPAAREALAVLP